MSDTEDAFLRVEAFACPMSTCGAPAGSPCRTTKNRVAIQYHTARFRLAERLRVGDIGLEFLTGELQGSHDPGGIVFTVLAALSGMEREYIRDKTLDGHESARNRGKNIGGATVTDPAMPSMALHLRDQGQSLRDIASQLLITQGAKKGKRPSPATVMRMLRDHDEHATTASQ